jgi:hypothetical protein
MLDHPARLWLLCMSIVLSAALVVPGDAPAASGGSCDMARQLVAEQCTCLDDWEGPRDYQQCVRRAAERLPEEHGTATCRREVNRCAARSICGASKAAVTCIVDGRCLIAASEAICFGKGGVADSGTSSCCDVKGL